jgi:nucleoside-diphosphate-sugar epimerase
MRTALVTGASGFVGRNFTRALLRDEQQLHIWALVRGKDGALPTQRPELAGLVDHPRFHVVEGDVTFAGLGLEPEEGVHGIPEALDACFHLAAKTDFKEARRAETFRANLEGTRNRIAFLKGLERPGRLFHISTAYVAGIRPGETDRERLRFLLGEHVRRMLHSPVKTPAPVVAMHRGRGGSDGREMEERLLSGGLLGADTGRPEGGR